MPFPACRSGALVARTSLQVASNRDGQKGRQLMSGCQNLASEIRPHTLPVHLGENREAAICRGLGIQLGGWGFLLSEADLTLDSDKLHKAVRIVDA